MNNTISKLFLPGHLHLYARNSWVLMFLITIVLQIVFALFLEEEIATKNDKTFPNQPLISKEQT